MSTINAFTQVSIDGYFAGPNGEIDWFKNIEKDDEYDKYQHQNASAGSTLLMGRTTYEMMKSFWPTDQARKMDPDMASVMNDSPKVVVSKSLKDVSDWNNVRILREMRQTHAAQHVRGLGELDVGVADDLDPVSPRVHEIQERAGEGGDARVGKRLPDRILVIHDEAEMTAVVRWLLATLLQRDELVAEIDERIRIAPAPELEFEKPAVERECLVDVADFERDVIESHGTCLA